MNYITSILAITTTILLGATSSAVAEDMALRILTWPGYADIDLVKEFERRTGSRVEISIVDNDALLWERVHQNDGQDFDVFAVNTAELQRYLDRGTVRPVNEHAVPNIANQQPRFRDANKVFGLTRDGKRYAVPYTYSEMGLIYDRRQFDHPPSSISALWDPRFQGKVLLYNGATHNFSLAAQLLGNSTPFNLQDSQWADAVEHLIALRRNAGAFYTQPDESVTLFKQKQAALMFANYGSQQVKLLSAADVDVGYAVPKEGALAWLDCWVITAKAHNPELAHRWIDFMLEPAPSQALRDRQGLANTTSPSPSVSSTDPIIWLEPVENVSLREVLWERILAGYRARKVMAP